ncbi:MAG: orotidine-5'-phosphate decarboxylase [Thermodesulfobacteriota bacterium]
MDYTKKIILALDSKALNENISLIDELVPPIEIVKIGPISFLPNSTKIIEKIKSTNCSVMFDFKFFDIPNTILESLDFLFDIKTKIFTVHCLSGPSLISSVVNRLKDLEHKYSQPRPEVFGVSILTSFDKEELNSIGLTGSIEDNVLRLVESSINAGIDGIVCSGHEVESIRRNFSDKIKILVPGVRFDSNDNDQKRVITPKKAFELGADYIVLGRTLTESENKKQRIDDIIKSLK